MRSLFRTSLLLLLIALSGGEQLQACAVPVFRYALERWDNDPFPLVVFYQGKLDAQLDKRLSDLEPIMVENAGPRVNWKVTRVNVDQPVPELWRGLWQAEAGQALPRAVLCTPELKKGDAAMWSGSLTEANLHSVVDSPKRKELVQHLLKGTAVVWLLVETAQPKKNEALAKLVQKESRRLLNEIVIPEGVGRDGVEVHSPLPLEVSFATVRVRQDDPAEATLLRLLTNGDKLKEPTLYPVFGRARALAAMPASTVNAQLLEETARFICGACSCQVKAQNPGFDLLVKADWDSIFGDQAAPPPESKVTPATKPVYVPIPQRKASSP